MNVTQCVTIHDMSTHGTLLTTREAASRLGVSVQTVSRWVMEGKLKPALKGSGIRGPLFFAADDVDEMGKSA